jgi:hypothetical protein
MAPPHLEIAFRLRERIAPGLFCIMEALTRTSSHRLHSDFTLLSKREIRENSNAPALQSCIRFKPLFRPTNRADTEASRECP